MVDLKKFTILVVDDDFDLRELMHSTFEMQGFTVISADNGNSAFEIIKNRKVDLVVSDMRMPNGDGAQLLQKVRTHNSSKPIVIFVTGYSDISVKQCLAMGAKAVFTKPFNQQELVNSVKAQLNIPLN